MINLMRIFQDRQSLERINLTFNQPVLEYANVVWNNCTHYEKGQIRKHTE